MRYDDRVPEPGTKSGAKNTGRDSGFVRKQASMSHESLPFAKKSLGQHWLTDKPTLEYICDFAEVSKDDTVLEIGPGVGTLTEVLKSRAGQVVAIEYDEKLASNLKTKYQDSPDVRIAQGDILQFDLGKLSKNYKAVANIPYYLTSNLLRVLCEAKNPPASMTLLVQKEVAGRIAAKAGDMSTLSVSVQFYCEVQLGEVLPTYLFTPPPKVDSQVIKLNYRQSPLFPDVKVDDFFAIVKAGFSERRKKLRSSLSGGLQLSKDAVEAWLAEAGIDANKRAQELTLADWHKLYKTFKSPRLP